MLNIRSIQIEKEKKIKVSEENKLDRRKRVGGDDDNGEEGKGKREQEEVGEKEAEDYKTDLLVIFLGRPSVKLNTRKPYRNITARNIFCFSYSTKHFIPYDKVPA
jgi:hypothetical protein